MNKYLRRIAASALALSIGLSLFTACSRGKSGQTVIDDGSPWYDVNTVVISDDVDMSDYEYRYNQYAGIIDDKIIFRTTSSYAPEGQSEAKSMEEIASYDFEGNLIVKTDLIEKLDSFNLGASIMVYNTMKADNGVKVVFVVFNADYSSSDYYFVNWNPDTGDVTDPEPYVNDEYSDVLGSSAPGRTFEVYDKKVEYYFVWDEQCDSYLLISSTDGNKILVDLAQELPTIDIENVFDIPVVMEKGDNKALVCLGMPDSIIYLDLDINTGAVSVSQDDYSWLEPYVSDIRHVDGFGNVVLNGDGIASIDFANRQLDEILSYSNSNVNRYVLDSLYPVMASDDRVVMTGVLDSPCVPGITSTNDNVLMVFTKADSNPNAGKTVIKIASIQGYSYSLCDAVCRFNDQSEGYFAMFDTRYELDNYARSELVGYGFDTLGALCREVNSELGNQLSVDLLAGDGPDIIIGGSSYSQLNNPDYLMDLTSYIDNSMSSSDYFMNVIDASKTGDAVYQLPISFSIAGITAPESDVQPGQIGFTFEQYSEFVSGPCNGADPLHYGKNDYFIALMNGMKDLMIDDDGYFNFDNEAFRALSDYTVQYVNNPLELEDEGYYYPEDDAACEMVLGGINTYHRRVINNDKVFLGYPSYDGRGPLIVGHSSIAVSSQSAAADGCLEFVSVVMSPECQRIFGCEYGLPVNRAAFDTIGNEYVEGFNRDITVSLRVNTVEELRDMGYSYEMIDDSVYTGLRDVIESLGGSLYQVDAPVDSIIIEEIPGYFEGQKTLDEVISIINNRSRSVTDERI